MYAVAEYETSRLGRNRAVFWDRIVEKEKDAVLSVRDEGKYLLLDDDNELRGKEVTVTLHWDVHPIVGSLGSYSDSSDPFVVQLPDEFTHAYKK